MRLRARAHIASSPRERQPIRTSIDDEGDDEVVLRVDVADDELLDDRRARSRRSRRAGSTEPAEDGGREPVDRDRESEL